MCFSQNIFKFSMLQTQASIYITVYIPAMMCTINLYEKINMFSLPRVIVSVNVALMRIKRCLLSLYNYTRNPSSLAVSFLTPKKKIFHQTWSTWVFPCNLVISGLFVSTCYDFIAQNWTIEKFNDSHGIYKMA